MDLNAGLGKCKDEPDKAAPAPAEQQNDGHNTKGDTVAKQELADVSESLDSLPPGALLSRYLEAKTDFDNTGSTKEADDTAAEASSARTVVTIVPADQQHDALDWVQGPR